MYNSDNTQTRHILIEKIFQRSFLDGELHRTAYVRNVCYNYDYIFMREDLKEIINPFNYSEFFFILTGVCTGMFVRKTHCENFK
jgi:hypothetical protein